MKRLLITFVFCVVALAGAEVDAEAVASLRQAEIDFAAAVADGDLEAFSAFIDEGATFVGGSSHRGKAAILEAWSVFFSQDPPLLTWAPDTSEVTPDGEIGMSSGPYRTMMASAEGEPVLGEGRFFSVWRRQDDGSWKIIFDRGSDPHPVEPPGS